MVSKKVVGGIVAVIVIAAIIGSIALLYTPKPTTSEQVTVMMPFVPVPPLAPYYVGIEKGFYAEEGLNVSLQFTPKGSGDAITQLVGGNAQFTQVNGDSLITARSKDLPIVAIYQVGHENLFGAIVKNNTNITSPRDLEGKTVAVPGPNAPMEITTKAMIENEGGDYNTVNFVYVGASIVPVLAEGKADAIGAYMVQEEILKSMGVDIKTFYGKDYGANFVTQCIATTEDIANNNPELVRKFIRATHKAYKYSVEHPEEAIDIFVKYNPQTNRELALRIWKRYIQEDMAVDKYPLGEINEAQWELTADTLYDMGIIQKKIKVSNAYRKDFIPS